jgi:hypothetical protein
MTEHERVLTEAWIASQEQSLQHNQATILKLQALKRALREMRIQLEQALKLGGKGERA